MRSCGVRARCRSTGDAGCCMCGGMPGEPVVNRPSDHLLLLCERSPRGERPIRCEARRVESLRESHRRAHGTMRERQVVARRFDRQRAVNRSETASEVTAGHCNGVPVNRSVTEVAHGGRGRAAVAEVTVDIGDVPDVGDVRNVGGKAQRVAETKPKAKAGPPRVERLEGRDRHPTDVRIAARSRARARAWAEAAWTRGIAKPRAAGAWATFAVR